MSSLESILNPDETGTMLSLEYMLNPDETGRGKHQTEGSNDKDTAAETAPPTNMGQLTTLKDKVKQAMEKHSKDFQYIVTSTDTDSMIFAICSTSKSEPSQAIDLVDRYIEGHCEPGTAYSELLLQNYLTSFASGRGYRSIATGKGSSKYDAGDMSAADLDKCKVRVSSLGYDPSNVCSLLCLKALSPR